MQRHDLVARRHILQIEVGQRDFTIGLLRSELHLVEIVFGNVFGHESHVIIARRIGTIHGSNTAMSKRPVFVLGRIGDHLTVVVVGDVEDLVLDHTLDAIGITFVKLRIRALRVLIRYTRVATFTSEVDEVLLVGPLVILNILQSIESTGLIGHRKIGIDNRGKISAAMRRVSHPGAKPVELLSAVKLGDGKVGQDVHRIGKVTIRRKRLLLYRERVLLQFACKAHFLLRSQRK